MASSLCSSLSSSQAGIPNVWLSNNYSNSGSTQVEVQDRSLDDTGNPDTLFTIPFNGGGRPIYDIPQALFDAVATGTADSGVNALDPDFDIAFGDSVGFIDRHLIYVPTGPTDPLVDFQWSAAEGAAFFQFAEDAGLGQYAGQILPRNAFHSDWWTKFDLKIEQELPGFADGHKFAGFLIIENLGNLLNDDWGVLRESGFPRYQSIINSNINANGQYVYSNFFAPNSQTRDTSASTWEMRVGFNYNF